MARKVQVEAGSDNIFADLGLPDANERLAKAQMAHQIAQLIKRRKLRQMEAATRLGIDQSKISALMRGKLSGFSTERLIRFLNMLDRDVEIGLCSQIVDRVKLDWRPKLVAIHNETDHRVMQEHGFGETNWFACQSLDPGPQRQMFAFDLLRVAFADGMGRSRQVPLIDSGSIGIKVHEPTGLQQVL